MLSSVKELFFGAAHKKRAGCVAESRAFVSCGLRGYEREVPSVLFLVCHVRALPRPYCLLYILYAPTEGPPSRVTSRVRWSATPRASPPPRTARSADDRRRLVGLHAHQGFGSQRDFACVRTPYAARPMPSLTQQCASWARAATCAASARRNEARAAQDQAKAPDVDFFARLPVGSNSNKTGRGSVALI